MGYSHLCHSLVYAIARCFRMLCKPCRFYEHFYASNTHKHTTPHATCSSPRVKSKFDAFTGTARLLERAGVQMHRTSSHAPVWDSMSR